MMAFNPNLPGQVPFRASKMPGFFFRKRVERIDWKRLASVDVCRVASQMDIDALQDNLVSVAFCDINSEIDTRYVDTNFIKLFQLAQLLIEYLLYSQDYLTNTVDSLRLENETIKKETDALKKRLEQQAQRLTSTRKECHRRRLLLLAQQRLMNSGPQSYHRCPHCTKAFINASFLNAHLFRRHSEVISALQDIDLNHASLLPLDSGTSFIVEKGTNGKPPVLAPNLEQQIQEVLDHLKSQIPPPPPPPLPLTSAVVQTIEAKGAASPRASAAVEAAWRQRAAELERQLEEERDHLRQLEERNRAWQESVASQYRTDVERVKEMFEVELRNLREENLETQRELIQLRIKKANVSNFEDVEADIPEQLERQVRSLEEVRSPMPKMVTVSPPKHSSEKVRSLPSSSDSPMTKVVRNTNNAAHSVRSSCSMISRGVSCSDKIGSLDHMLHAISNVPKKRSRHQQTSDRESLSLANASIQVAPNEVTSRLVTRTLTSPQKQQALLTNRGVVVESLIVRTEDEEDGESDRTRSIHLIPFAVSTPSFLRTVLNEAPPKREGYRPYNEAELGNNKIVQLADDSSNKSEYAKERVSKSRPTTQPNAEKSHNPLQANGSELRVDPLEGISHYKDQLEEFRSDPDAMKRLRKEVESLLVEQLIDHDVDGDAVGLTRGKFTETLDTLGQERQHLTRKHPNFAEIRASIARKVDRMALIALHSKRGRHDSALRGGSNGFGGGDGDVDGEGLQKKPRASRIADRDALSRPPSGRPASLTSLTHTLSPIVEYRRFATASPALRKTNPTQSKQSLFENTEDEGDDGDGRVVKVEGRTAVYRPPVVGLTACVDVATSNVNTPTTSTTPLPPKMVVSNDSTKLASKTVRIQEVDLRSKSEDSDETKEKKALRGIIKSHTLNAPKMGTTSKWDNSNEDGVKHQTAKKFHQSMNEEVDDRFQSKNQSPGHSVKFSDENEPRKNNNPDEDDDDDGPVSVFSILSEEQGDIGLSPMRPETRRGERADPVASSVTTLSPLRPGASYTISTSQWDTSSQVNDNQRFGRGEPDDRLDSDA